MLDRFFFERFLAAGITAAFCGNLWYVSRAAVHALLAAPTKRRPVRILAALAIIGVLCTMLYATRHTPLRGGYDNDHDFGYLSTRGPEEPAQWVSTGKETSPMLIFWIFDRASGFSLDGILWGQKILWLLNALILLALLRRLRLSVSACVLAAGGFSLSFLALMSDYSFSTTNANLFFLLSALYSLSVWFTDDGGESRTVSAVGLACSTFLVLTARYELLPPLAAGFALAVFAGYRDARKRRSLGIPPADIAIGTLWMAFAAAWGFKLRQLTDYNGPHLGQLSASQGLEVLAHHLGEHFLTPLTGGPPLLFGVSGACLTAWGLAHGWRNRTQRPARWILFLSLWCLYSAAAYMPLALYPFEFVRHHLFVILPFMLLGGSAFDLWSKKMTKERLRAGAAVALAAYGWLNMRYLKRTAEEVRTNDIEWDFLHEAQRRWPAPCVVVGALGDTRGPLLLKYFPHPSAGQTAECQVVYRAPNYQVFYTQDGATLRSAERYLGPPVLERRLVHRFYTVWHGPQHLPMQETMDPIPLRIGFYRIDADAVPPEIARSILFSTGPDDDR